MASSSGRRMSTDMELTAECGWTQPLEVLQVPELHRQTFLSSAVHQGSYLTLYGFVLQQLPLCGNIEDERAVLTQMISWSHAVKPRFTFIAIYCRSSSYLLCHGFSRHLGSPVRLFIVLRHNALSDWFIVIHVRWYPRRRLRYRCHVCLIYCHPCPVISTA